MPLKQLRASKSQPEQEMLVEGEPIIRIDSVNYLFNGATLSNFNMKDFKSLIALGRDVGCGLCHMSDIGKDGRGEGVQ